MADRFSPNPLTPDAERYLRHLARTRSAGALWVRLLDELDRQRARADHAEKKWHGWHRHTGTFGITCPLCALTDPPSSERTDDEKPTVVGPE